MTSLKFAFVVAALLASGLAAQASTIAPPAGATAIFSDDFDSYANDSAFKAVWAPDSGSTVELAVGADGNGGNAVWNPGGPVAQTNFTSVGFTDANPVVIETDYQDYATGGSDRLTLGVRSANAQFEIGEKNSMDDGSNYPNSGAQVQGYGFRALSVGAPQGAGSYWWTITQDKVAGWHHFKLVIGGTYATGSVTLSNGNTYSRTVSLTASAGKTLDNVRIGGPAGVTSTAGGLFDNVRIYATPEPASLLLIGLGGLLLRRRTRA